MSRLVRVLLTLAATFLMAFAAPASTMAASNGDCDWLTQDNFFGGLAKVGSTSGTWKNAARAELYTDTSRFDPCTNPGLLEASMASQWVALEGADHLFGSCWGCPGANNIVQVGLIRCQTDSVFGGSPITSPCHSSKAMDLRYFYAWGADYEDSCGWGDHSPVPIDLGSAVEDQWQVFEVIYDTDADDIIFKINFVEKARIDAGPVCWVNNVQTKATWRVETWDPGDGLGGIEAPARFKTFYYKEGGNFSWVSSTWPSCSSAQLDPDFRCSFFNTGSYGFYTVN